MAGTGLLVEGVHVSPLILKGDDPLCSGRSPCFELLTHKCGLTLVKYVQSYWMEAFWHAIAGGRCRAGGVLVHFRLPLSFPL